MDIAERVYGDIELLNLGLCDMQEVSLSLAAYLCKHPASPPADVIAERVKRYASEEGCSNPDLAAANARIIVENAIEKMDYVRFMENRSNIMNCENCKENRCKKRSDGYGLPCGLARCFVCTTIEQGGFYCEQE